MERLDMLIVTLERGNAINLAHLEMLMESNKLKPSSRATSTSEQIKATIEAQRTRLREASGG